MSRLYLRHFTEVSLADVPTDALVGRIHVLAHKSEGIGHSQQREQLVLLSLEVEDLRLWLSVGQKHICCWNYTAVFKCSVSQCIINMILI